MWIPYGAAKAAADFIPTGEEPKLKIPAGEDFDHIRERLKQLQEERQKVLDRPLE